MILESPDPHRPAGLLGSSAVHVGWTLLLVGVLLLSNLDVGGLAGYDDAFYASEGKTMLRTGDWLTVRYNGQVNCEYPPLFIWFEASSMKLFGVSDFAAKLPAAVCGLGLLLLVFGIVHTLTRSFWLPIVSMWILTLNGVFLKSSTHAMTDIPFTFLFALAIYLGVSSRGRPARLVACGAAIAACVMTRSVLGLVPLAILVGFTAAAPRASRRSWGWLGVCAVIGLGIPLAWYLLGPGRPCLDGHLAFVFGKAVAKQSRGLSEWARGALVYPAGLATRFVWWPFAIVGLWTQWKAARRERDPLAVLLLLWLVLVIIPLAFASEKLFRYILPAFPALAILAAVPIQRWVERRKPRTILAVYAFLGVATLIASVWPNRSDRAADMRLLAPIASRESAPGDHIALYAGGRVAFDYGNQLLWYGDRLVDYVTDLESLRTRLESSARTVVIMDRESYSNLKTSPLISPRLLGRSSGFVCWTAR